MLARSRALAASAVTALCLTPLAACGASYEPLTKKNLPDEVVDAMVTAKSGHMEMDMGPMKAEGDFMYDGADTRIHMEMGQGAQQMEIIVADKVMYLKAPGLTEGGKWARLDENAKGVGELLKKSLSSTNPAEQIETMEKGLKKVEYVGEKKIGGEELHEYEVTVDPRVGLQGSKLPQSGVPASVTYTMYLDDENLLRKMEMSVVGQKLDMEMSDWGKEVDVDVPDDKDVVEFNMPTAPQQ